jgi:hypothetical protein
MQTMLWMLDMVFGCHHPLLSRVFTLNGRTYRVCCKCGARFAYSLDGMCMGQRLAEAPLESVTMREETRRWGLA